MGTSEFEPRRKAPPIEPLFELFARDLSSESARIRYLTDCQQTIYRECGGSDCRIPIGSSSLARAPVCDAPRTSEYRALLTPVFLFRGAQKSYRRVNLARERANCGSVGAVSREMRLHPAPGSNRGPGLPKMAFGAVRSAVRFVGTGLQTAADPTRQRRLRSCASCEHHTRLCCRLCGCFTNVKARMAHETCPAG